MPKLQSQHVNESAILGLLGHKSLGRKPAGGHALKAVFTKNWKEHLKTIRRLHFRGSVVVYKLREAPGEWKAESRWRRSSAFLPLGGAWVGAATGCYF